jgi:hypothetical protein
MFNNLILQRLLGCRYCKTVQTYENTRSTRLERLSAISYRGNKDEHRRKGHDELAFGFDSKVIKSIRFPASHEV